MLLLQHVYILYTETQKIHKMVNLIAKFEELMVEYLKGDSTPEDICRLTNLLKEHSACRERYAEMAQAYGLSATPWFEDNKQRNLEKLRERLNFRSSRKNKYLRRMRVWGNAAIWALAVCSTLTLFYFYNSSPKELSTSACCQIEIPKGATSKLLLPDSTLVFLNGGTTIKYDASFEGKSNREVFLTGEACFQVTKNAVKPFIVHTSDLNVRVLGTTFNVSSYPDEQEVKVSLVEGRVNVSTISGPQKEVSLSPDEQAVYSKQNKELFTKNVDASSLVAWAKGRFIFTNKTLFHLLQIIEKRYDIQFQVKTEKVYHEYYSGNIDANLTLDEVLSYLDIDKKFVWKRKGRVVIISDR